MNKGKFLIYPLAALGSLLILNLPPAVAIAGGGAMMLMMISLRWLNDHLRTKSKSAKTQPCSEAVQRQLNRLNNLIMMGRHDLNIPQGRQLSYKYEKIAAEFKRRARRIAAETTDSEALKILNEQFRQILIINGEYLTGEISLEECLNKLSVFLP